MKLNKMYLPDFLVVGSMKAGTTALAEYLKIHPKIFMPNEEVHFFDNPKNYAKGIPYYSKFFKPNQNQTLIGEKTPTYSYLPDIPERIYKLTPEIKLIWVFREPVSRSYSNYWHAVKNGFERLGFQLSCEIETERIKHDPFKGYLRRSIYIEQIENYLKYFSQDNMLFLLQEDLKKDKESTLRKISSFLNIEFDKDWLNLEKKSNVTRIPKSRWLQFYGKKYFDGTKVYSLIWRLNQKRKPGYPSMESDLKSQLKEYFRPHNKKLGELIKRDLSHWD